MLSFPNHGHFRSGHPEGMFSRKSSSSKHVIVWIDVHVVLFRPIIEIVQAGRDWIGVLHNIDQVIYDISGMGDELAAGHKLIVRMVTETIVHPAMESGYS